MGRYYQRDTAASVPVTYNGTSNNTVWETLELSTITGTAATKTHSAAAGVGIFHNSAWAFTFSVAPSSYMGNYGTQMDVVTAGSSISYRAHWASINDAGTQGQEFYQQEANFTGTGLRLGTRLLDISVSTRPRFAAYINVANSNMMAAEDITLRVNTEDSYVDVPWTVSAPPPPVPQGQFTVHDRGTIDWEGYQPNTVAYDLERQRWDGTAWVDSVVHTDRHGEVKRESGLESGTLYRWRVRTVYGGETSDWSAWVEFTTTALAALGQFSVSDRTTAPWAGGRGSTGQAADAFDHTAVAVTGTAPQVGQFTAHATETVQVAGTTAQVGQFSLVDETVAAWSGIAPAIEAVEGQFLTTDTTTAAFTGSIGVAAEFGVADRVTVFWSAEAPVVLPAEGQFAATDTAVVAVATTRPSVGTAGAVDHTAVQVDTSTEVSGQFSLVDEVVAAWTAVAPTVDAAEGQFLVSDASTAAFTGTRTSTGAATAVDTVTVAAAGTVVPASQYMAVDTATAAATGTTVAAGQFAVVDEVEAAWAATTEAAAQFQAEDAVTLYWTASAPDVDAAVGQFSLVDTVNADFSGVRASSAGFASTGTSTVHVAGSRESVGQVAATDLTPVVMEGQRAATTEFDLVDAVYTDWSGLSPEIGIATGNFAAVDTTTADFATVVEVSGEFAVHDTVTVTYEARAKGVVPDFYVLQGHEITDASSSVLLGNLSALYEITKITSENIQNHSNALSITSATEALDHLVYLGFKVEVVDLADLYQLSVSNTDSVTAVVNTDADVKISKISASAGLTPTSADTTLGSVNATSQVVHLSFDTEFVDASVAYEFARRG